MPKPTTGERLVKIETDLTHIKEETNEIKTLLKDHIMQCDQKFASKWVEKGIIAVGSAVVLFLIQQVITVI